MIKYEGPNFSTPFKGSSKIGTYSKKVQRDMQILTDNEDFLTDKLSGEEKKRFIQYVDAWASINGESTLDSFITGFRLGAQFAFDTFVTSKAPYTDYLKDEI